MAVLLLPWTRWSRVSAGKRKTEKENNGVRKSKVGKQRGQVKYSRSIPHSYRGPKPTPPLLHGGEACPSPVCVDRLQRHRAQDNGVLSNHRRVTRDFLDPPRRNVKAAATPPPRCPAIL